MPPHTRRTARPPACACATSGVGGVPAVPPYTLRPFPPCARHGGNPWSVPSVPSCTNPQPSPLAPDTFESGLNNQRISLLKAARLAADNGLVLVLPTFKDIHGKWWFLPSLSFPSSWHATGCAPLRLQPLSLTYFSCLLFSSFPPSGVLYRNDPGSAVLLPFDHLYDADAFAAHAASSGFAVARSLPADRVDACIKQLNLQSDFAWTATPAFFLEWAAAFKAGL